MLLPAVYPPGRREQSATGNEDTKKLLNLLGKRKAEEQLAPPALATKPAQQETPQRATPSHRLPTRSSQPAKRGFEPKVMFPGIHWPSQDTPPAKTSQRDYARRRIPRDQQTLLDEASSWLPALPGKTFPQPNVPIELLKRWNAQVSAQAQGDEINALPKKNKAQAGAEEPQG